jgi:UDP-N-acetylmuramate dehydrogenase
VTERAEILARELPGLRSHVPLAPLTAYRVGGPAEFLHEAHTTEALRHAVVVARQVGIAVTVLGQATNVLVGEAGVAGLVVLARNGATTLADELLTVGAGAVLPDVVGALARDGLAGLEFAGNIPGSIGGAVVGNAGAYGRSVADALVRVRLLAGDEEHVATPRDLDFGYRTSALKRAPGTIVLEATFGLERGDSAALLAEIARDAELRRQKHPLEYGSCGSYFKNPSPERPAARLIEEAGLKGFRLGSAEVSAKHANFIIALPGAGAGDIRRLAGEVKRRVLETSGVRLEEEVRMLGFDDGGD